MGNDAVKLISNQQFHILINYGFDFEYDQIAQISKNMGFCYPNAKLSSYRFLKEGHNGIIQVYFFQGSQRKQLLYETSIDQFNIEKTISQINKKIGLSLQ